MVLEKLLEFRHTFEASHCARLLYSSLLGVVVRGRARALADVALRPFIEKLAREYLINSTNFAVEVWPLIREAGGMWLGARFMGLDHCIWTAGGGQTSELWAILQRLSSEAGVPIVVVDEALTALLEGSDHQALLASARTCCLKGSTDAKGFTAAPLPFPTDVEMLLNKELPELLKEDSVDSHEDADDIR